MHTLRYALRGFLIAFLLLKQFVIWVVGWLLLLLALRGKARRQCWFGDRVRALLVDLGATFIKVGQIMSTRPDLFPPHLTKALEKLQDDVGAFGQKHVTRTFLEEFGELPEQVFASFEPEPIASASVAQVHRAVLMDGTEVAVKVRRPYLEEIVAFDLRVMRLFARIVCIVPSMRLLAPVESVEEFARSIRAQIDFKIEAANNRRFRENFADDRDVTFPVLVEDYCSSRILTMHYVSGVKVLDFHHSDADPTRLARIGFHTLLKMVFEDGFVHADLHPGNIFITESNEVVLLDLGLTAEISEHDRVSFARFFGAWAAGDGKAMTRFMLEISPNPEVADYAALEAEVVAFVAKYDGKALGEVKVATVALDVMNIVRHHRVRVNPNFTMCIIAIAVTEGIGKQLDPELDLIHEAMPFFVRLRSLGKL